MKTSITKIKNTHVNAWVRSTTAGLIIALSLASCEDSASEITPATETSFNMSGQVAMSPVTTSAEHNIYMSGDSKDTNLGAYTIDMDHVQHEDEEGVTVIAKGVWTLDNGNGDRLVATYDGILHDDEYPVYEIKAAVGIKEGRFDRSFGELKISCHDANEDGTFELSFSLIGQSRD